MCPGQGESLILEPPHSRTVRHSRARAVQAHHQPSDCVVHTTAQHSMTGWVSVSMMTQAPLDKKQRKALYDSIEHGLGVRAICSCMAALLCLT